MGYIGLGGGELFCRAEQLALNQGSYYSATKRQPPYPVLPPCLAQSGSLIHVGKTTKDGTTPATSVPVLKKPTTNLNAKPSPSRSTSTPILKPKPLIKSLTSPQKTAVTSVGKTASYTEMPA